MRSIHMQDIAHLSPVITRAEVAPVVVQEVKVASHIDPVADPLTDAIRDFPSHLAKAMAAIPAPVMAPRPAGTWIIDVKRNGAGQMSQMEAKFHETK
jgi:hypothetical protein